MAPHLRADLLRSIQRHIDAGDDQAYQLIIEGGLVDLSDWKAADVEALMRLIVERAPAEQLGWIADHMRVQAGVLDQYLAEGGDLGYVRRVEKERSIAP